MHKIELDSIVYSVVMFTDEFSHHRTVVMLLNYLALIGFRCTRMDRIVQQGLMLHSDDSKNKSSARIWRKTISLSVVVICTQVLRLLGD